MSAPNEKRRPGRGGVDRKPGSNRLVRMYANPFDPAMPIGPLALAIVVEVERRIGAAARAGKVGA